MKTTVPLGPPGANSGCSNPANADRRAAAAAVGSSSDYHRKLAASATFCLQQATPRLAACDGSCDGVGAAFCHRGRLRTSWRRWLCVSLE
jgi:hypothetical protein